MDFLNHPETERIIRGGLAEDIHEGDHTTLATVPAGARSRARALVKDTGVIAGVALAEKIFRMLDPDAVFTLFIPDGSPVKYGDEPFHVAATDRALLSGERLVLNLMQRMSGIATQTHSLVQELQGLPTRLLDTRKTTPLVRHIEKWAVVIGGGMNHRFGLYDMIMIKDNHVDYCGGIRQAIERVHAYLRENGLNLPIEVETRNLDEVQQVLDTGGIQRIMLDNMHPELMREAVSLIGGRYETEASGNITRENIRAKALSGVDFISVGALTHSVRSLDISLKALPD